MFLGCHTMRSFLQWSLPCLMAPWSGRWWCTGIPWFFTAQTRSPLPTFTYCPLCCLLGESKIWLCTAVKFLSRILTSFCNSRTNEVLIWLNCIMQWICSFLEDLFIKCTKNCIYGQSDTVTTYDVMYFFLDLVSVGTERKCPSTGLMNLYQKCWSCPPFGCWLFHLPAFFCTV